MCLYTLMSVDSTITLFLSKQEVVVVKIYFNKGSPINNCWSTWELRVVIVQGPNIQGQAWVIVIHAVISRFMTKCKST